MRIVFGSPEANVILKKDKKIDEQIVKERRFLEEDETALIELKETIRPLSNKIYMTKIEGKHVPPEWERKLRYLQSKYRQTEESIDNREKFLERYAI